MKQIKTGGKQISGLLGTFKVNLSPAEQNQLPTGE
jgi:hypothetical protein